jgi:hypothetical protein
MAVARALLAADDDVLEASAQHPALAGARHPRPPSGPPSDGGRGGADGGAGRGAGAGAGGGRGRGRRPKGGAESDALWAPGARERTRAAFAAAPQFIMLDFRRGALCARLHTPSSTCLWRAATHHINMATAIVGCCFATNMNSSKIFFVCARQARLHIHRRYWLVLRRRRSACLRCYVSGAPGRRVVTWPCCLSAATTHPPHVASA